MFVFAIAVSVCMHLLIDDYATKVSCIASTNLILALATLAYMYISGNGKPKQLTEQKANKRQKCPSKVGYKTFERHFSSPPDEELSR